MPGGTGILAGHFYLHDRLEACPTRKTDGWKPVLPRKQTAWVLSLTALDNHSPDASHRDCTIFWNLFRDSRRENDC